MMAKLLPPALVVALERLAATRRRYGRPLGPAPRVAPAGPAVARNRPPGEAAQASARFLREAIKGELPWWARD